MVSLTFDHAMIRKINLLKLSQFFLKSQLKLIKPLMIIAKFGLELNNYC